MKKLKMLLFAAIVILSVPAFSQEKTKDDAKKQTEKGNKTKSYFCPKHQDVSYDKPGKCPVCGTELKERSKKEKHYVCPMHPEETSNKQAKCPKCGMDMKEIAKTKGEKGEKGGKGDKGEKKSNES